MARTLDEILNDRNIFTQERADNIEANALKEAEKYWGGKRKGAGRKPKGEYSLNVQIKVSDMEKRVLIYARENNITIQISDIEFLKYARENGLNLSKMIET